jgi:2-polyprenyl-3-methyl-5-hydroxy-6-metoxy-1,4-benzoquinol methylase
MAIGSYSHVLYDGAIVKRLVRWLGTADLHTHLRVAPLLQVFPTLSFPTPEPRLLEAGCGSGINLFELAQIVPISATGFDVHEEAIATANQILRHLNFSHLNFLHADLESLPSLDLFDGLLLMDVLEHVHRPAGFLKCLGSYLKPGGYLFVSVPTPWYPRVFGQSFHEEIGHLVNGYRLSDLLDFTSHSYRLVTHRYHTGPFVWPSCFLMYRFFRHLPRPARLLTSGVLTTTRLLDRLNGAHLSASLFATFQKYPQFEGI